MLCSPPPATLYVVVPCYNEEQVLPVTSDIFLKELTHLIDVGKISPESRIMFVDDGSRDTTWDIISKLAENCEHFIGTRLSRNRGHQNAVLCGMMECRGKADAVVTVDCDGQDDITAIERMVDEYTSGSEIVYGVRSSRKTDTFFKRFTAQSFYKLLASMGVEVVYNHADYRLVSARVLDSFADFREVNLFLRGMFPLVGFKSSAVEYERHERLAGKSHYPLSKMIALAVDGITSLSVRPLRLIFGLGAFAAFFSLIALIWSLIAYLTGYAAPLAAIISAIVFVGGVQLVCFGVVGEYIGKIYMEVKARPRYIVSERTDSDRTSNNADEKDKKDSGVK